MSLILKIGKLKLKISNSIKSLTYPTNSLSMKFPMIPPKSSPKARILRLFLLNDFIY
jgi:hypothetical protein